MSPSKSNEIKNIYPHKKRAYHFTGEHKAYLLVFLKLKAFKKNPD